MLLLHVMRAVAAQFVAGSLVVAQVKTAMRAWPRAAGDVEVGPRVASSTQATGAGALRGLCESVAI
jgi:hypothetical protein